MARVLLAPDKFKGTLSGAEVAASLAEGIRSRRPTVEVVAVPVADGGDGSLAAFEAVGFERSTCVAARTRSWSWPRWPGWPG
jgi:glycerate kinase